MKNLDNIIEAAAQLIIEGKATIDTAFEMALKADMARCEKAIDDMRDMKAGYINPENKTQKAANILMHSVYKEKN